MITGDWGDLDALFTRAETLAGAWSARARAATTIGQERALLRLFGVDGLGRDGSPLAASVVDRWRSSDPAALAGGIALPFAMALLEYDLTPQQLALDVASGTIDLMLEARLLLQADRRAVAEIEAVRLATAAAARIEANRTARTELISVLGDPVGPWIGTTLTHGELADALGWSATLTAGGIDAVRIDVPVGRELSDRLARIGHEPHRWQPSPRPASRSDRSEGPDPTPTGSQRGLASLRADLDRHAAERRSYVRLATAAPAFGAPEGSVVAAFERVDIVESDPMAEIVVGGVDPDRALADQAFAHRLLRHAGTVISIDAGPLVVAPDLARGEPSDSPTRSGRALALQLLGVALARASGLPPAAIVVGALPTWIAGEAMPGARAIAEVAIRRALFESHSLRFDEPAPIHERVPTWPLIASVLPHAGATALLVCRPSDDPVTVARTARGMASFAAEVAGSTTDTRLAGPALDHARASVAAAGRTLDRLSNEGWRSVVGDGPAQGGKFGLGADSVADRTEAFDPFETALGSRD